MDLNSFFMNRNMPVDSNGMMIPSGPFEKMAINTKRGNRRASRGLAVLLYILKNVYNERTINMHMSMSILTRMAGPIKKLLVKIIVHRSEVQYPKECS